MTPNEFITWLNGFKSGFNPDEITKEKWLEVLTKLNQVTNNTNLTFEIPINEYIGLNNNASVSDITYKTDVFLTKTY